jgi:hypothetical protein
MRTLSFTEVAALSRSRDDLQRKELAAAMGDDAMRDIMTMLFLVA